VISYAKEKGLLTILDCKRSDVPHVFESVIRHSFGNFITEKRKSPDAITINPFISLSSIFSMLEEIRIPNKCIYVSTNAYASPYINIPENLINAADMFSDELTSSLSVYRSQSVSLQSIELGLVSSCIFPTRLTAVATSFNGPILIPGYGAQAGKLPHNFSELSRMRCLVSVSRSMIPKDTTNKRVWQSTIISNIEHLNNLIKLSP
jgi:orotidine-5'-phosphate decarboxylase